MNEIPQRVSVLESLLENNASGAIKLYTSTISQVEVAFVGFEKRQRALSPETEQRINGLWASIECIDFDETIAWLARELMRDAITREWNLKTLDAIHLATAKWLTDEGITIEEFHTYDKALVKYKSFVSFNITEPYTQQIRML